MKRHYSPHEPAPARERGLLDRRTLLAGGLFLAAAPLAGCQTVVGLPGQPALPDESFDYATAYAALPDGDFTWPAINYKSFDEKYWRQVVEYKSRQTPGTVVVDPYNNFLYWTLSRDKCLRYGIGVGQAGFAWSGEALIRVKREHPLWRPPREMIARKPSLERYWVEGYPPGLKNPLGARAMDLWQGSTDTLYRIHGTNQPSSIGKSVSSGCIRMWQQDVIDLFNRVPLRTKVVVLDKAPQTTA
ncbi:L,D-transpeptidase [Roseibium salinum]|uniref:L,D-transpeptidase n=1 Tax=Roseibium salinum TaxID=1604349 RepID=A0ABT3R2U0_9HYPH|nr:L,D-transpeptidase [Roseibium sp. DSM 29163]MCX2723523.1 L,D-transpeptidase [Roseibium sp. DSM 29163]